MSGEKEKLRGAFRVAVFERDHFRCRACGATHSALGTTIDAHHIHPREGFPNGGYVVENGITLCKDLCHLLAEKVLKEHKGGIDGYIRPLFHQDFLYALIGSSYQLALRADSKE